MPAGARPIGGQARDGFVKSVELVEGKRRVRVIGIGQDEFMSPWHTRVWENMGDCKREGTSSVSNPSRLMPVSTLR